MVIVFSFLLRWSGIAFRVAVKIKKTMEKRSCESVQGKGLKQRGSGVSSFISFAFLVASLRFSLV